MRFTGFSPRACALAAATCVLAAGCASTEPGPTRPETILAITSGNALLSFNAGRPQVVLSRVQVGGLEAGESITAIDIRPANGRLFGATSTGRLLTIDPKSGTAQQVGTARFASFTKDREIGFDFNPVVDRIRVVDEAGTNLRLHPDTGAVVDADPKADGVQVDGRLGYAMEDRHEGQPARVTGAAYTRGAGAKATTNYAIDSAQDMLVTQGSREGDPPAKAPVTPNAGRLFTIGWLGVTAGDYVGFDIAPGTSAAYATFSQGAGAVFYSINLETGAATRIGPVGAGEQVRGIAIAR
jgi:hypothetical protein